MLHFIYTFSETERKSGGQWRTYKTATVYRIVKGRPVRVGTQTDTFVSEMQLVMQVLKDAKALPARAYKLTYPDGRIKEHPGKYDLIEAGIATIDGV